MDGWILYILSKFSKSSLLWATLPTKWREDNREQLHISCYKSWWVWCFNNSDSGICPDSDVIKGLAMALFASQHTPKSRCETVDPCTNGILASWSAISLFSKWWVNLPYFLLGMVSKRGIKILFSSFYLHVCC